MNSLKIKILILMTSIMAVAVTLTAWHHLQTQKITLTRMIEQNGRILADTISNTFTSAPHEEKAPILNTLEKIGKNPSIQSIRIFNENGRITFSADPEEIGNSIPSSDLQNYISEHSSHRNVQPDGEYHGTLLPIENSISCHGCHDPAIKVLGVLGLHLSLDSLESLQKEVRQKTVFSSLIIVVILILSIYLFILLYVDQPIRRFAEAMTQVEKGNFDRARIRVKSSSEMYLMASKFNLMVERLKGLIETKILQEKEIAVAQEKLAHHSEIKQMNHMLGERLREIEDLNILLEERIEEIEEANYKVSELANDLEGKNVTLEQTVSRLSAVYKIGLAVNSTIEMKKLFNLLIRKTMEPLQARIGYILLLDRDEWNLAIADEVGCPGHLDRKKRIPLNNGGISHWVITHGAPRLIEDVENEEDLSNISRLGFRRESVICAPLTNKKEIIGTITMANKTDGSFFAPADLQLLVTIAAQASIAIQNAQLYEEQQITYLSTVQSLVSVMEASDPYTRGHSERVTRYSIGLARRMDLSPDALKTLERAAILHDIGKIGIDSTILHKEDRLEEEETAVMERHPAIGYHILEPIAFLREVGKIIEQHHERYDGTGYPHRISGNDLRLESRILAVADTFDAMTTDRPYRKALSVEVTLQEIADMAGTQFDPQVAETFIQLYRDGAFSEIPEEEPLSAHAVFTV